MPKSPQQPMSDVALRKKKNADAQAAFRARRANYIATLEETVTSLENVVLQLQESWRESRNESLELRQENARLRYENREREKLLRGFYQPRKSGQPTDIEDLPQPPSSLSSPFPAHSQPQPAQSHSNLIHPSFNPSVQPFRSDEHTPYNQPTAAFQSQPPFQNGDAQPAVTTDAPSGPVINHRSGRYTPYPSYSIQGSPKDPRWQQPPPLNASMNPESTSPSHPQSPAYLESPSMTSTDMTYASRFNPDDQQKLPLNSVLDGAPYVFPNPERFHHAIPESVPHSRSMSPSSTPSSSTSLPLTSSLPFAFPNQQNPEDRPEFDYRRHSLPHSAEVNLHPGATDMSLAVQQNDPARYRVPRNLDPVAGHPPILSGAPSESGSQHDGGSIDGDSIARARSRMNTIHSLSRSPSPGSGTISCTVAVIKAQAFGALRRTRARTKKSSEGAAKVAMDVLEARGIGMGVSAGSQQHDDDDLDVETP
ncbi:hypothetical protein CVT24_011600 [Panaeolus cyanescens]|uniref:BZIP domain-containing protein n=1 Tax=Panaeolus cyanescens TaxID=181874 RepID=A0A409YV86_9AGAR|nr:hypothetical protein CVT24_011600 [Panaeolus cyanescens]